MLYTDTFVVVTFFYKHKPEKIVLSIPIKDFKKDVERIVSRNGVLRHSDTRVDLTMINRLEIDFIHDTAVL